MPGYVGDLLQGIGSTVSITLLAFLLGAVLGVPLVAAVRSRWLVLRVVTRFVLDLLRAIPPLVWLFLLFYGVSSAITLAAYPAAVIGLGVVSAAYMAEIYRGGLLAVRRQQWEAGAALGLTRGQVLRSIVVPQTVRIVVPGSATWGIGLLKETAIVSIIGVQDVTFRAVTEARDTPDGLGVFIAAGLIYIALSVPIAALARWTDTRLTKAMVR
jgi:polar amino acid transport system permease protein